MKPLLIRLISTDDAVDIIEYALLLGFIALVSVAIIDTLGSSVGSAIDSADTQLRSDGGI